jgi:hypothetical protein
VAGNLLVINDTYWLQVDRALYLPTTAMAVTPLSPPVPADWQHSHPLDTKPLTTLNNVTLLGGDATDNDGVDLLDATCIGTDYGTSTSTCAPPVPPPPPDPNFGPSPNSDVNGSGAIDLLDLTLMGINYYRTSSPWSP